MLCTVATALRSTSSATMAADAPDERKGCARAKGLRAHSIGSQDSALLMCLAHCCWLLLLRQFAAVPRVRSAMSDPNEKKQQQPEQQGEKADKRIVLGRDKDGRLLPGALPFAVVDRFGFRLVSMEEQQLVAEHEAMAQRQQLPSLEHEEPPDDREFIDLTADSPPPVVQASADAALDAPSSSAAAAVLMPSSPPVPSQPQQARSHAQP